MYFQFCVALFLFDYNGQLLENAICLVVLFFCHFIVVLLLFFERNKWRWRWRWRKLRRRLSRKTNAVAYQLLVS